MTMRAARQTPATSPRRPLRGSASVELVVITPLALVLMAAIWDLREFAAYRTDIVREQYAAVELMANETDASAAAVYAILQAAMQRMSARSAGALRAVVVTRTTSTTATTFGGGTLCNPSTGTPPASCPPMVRAELRPSTDNSPGQPIQWQSGGDCATVQSSLPAVGADFGSGVTVLPREGEDPDGDGPLTTAAEQDWTSRRLTAEEWWLVVEICSHFGGGTSDPGLIGGALVDLIGQTLNVRQTISRRVAWGGPVDLDECCWCGHASPPATCPST